MSSRFPRCPQGSWASTTTLNRDKDRGGAETRPQRSVAVGLNGKKKVGERFMPSITFENPTSPLPLEVLLFDPSLFEELLLEGPDEEVISSLGAVYDGEAVKGVQKLLKDIIPFLQDGYHSKRFSLYSYALVGALC